METFRCPLEEQIGAAVCLGSGAVGKTCIPRDLDQRPREGACVCARVCVCAREQTFVHLDTQRYNTFFCQQEGNHSEQTITVRADNVGEEALPLFVCVPVCSVLVTGLRK